MLPTSLASPYSIVILAVIAMLVAAGLAMVIAGNREGPYGAERTRSSHDGGIFGSDADGCDGD
ncbi:hypothetical protein [Stappia indica]|uniref:hypothetical protein n=1 Tax=Stappia indica TaxID=538381 RepID=UPI001495AAC0|nr:hypothetical protein [Stappia indica]